MANHTYVYFLWETSNQERKKPMTMVEMIAHGGKRYIIIVVQCQVKINDYK